MEIPFYLYLNLMTFCLGVLLWNRLDTKLRSIIYYLAYCFIVESLAWIYSFILFKSNHWIYNIFTTGQLLALGIIYQKILNSKNFDYSLRAFTFIYPVLVSINFIFIQSFFKFHTLTYTIGCLFIICLVFSYFNQLLHSSEVLRLRTNPFFWINIGNSVYFIGSLFYLGSVNFILESKMDKYGDLINLFVYSFVSIQYIFFIIALTCNLKAKVS
jgi:hypothetical protein